MKIAIVCDWLVTIGGGEKVLEQMLLCYPEADLFSLVDFLPPEKRGIIQNKNVTTSFIQRLPFAKSKYRTYLPLMPLAIEQLDLSSYDLIISSSHAVAKGVITGPDQLHICYCHSPIRYAWDLQHQYLRESNLTRGPKSWFARWILHKIRLWDLRTVNNVDYFIANSKFIARRIKKVYARDATVIYPPVNLKTAQSLPREDFYITISRMVPYKRIDIIVEAFINSPQRKLVVIGDGPFYTKIKAQVGNAENIKLLGYQSDEVVSDYLSRAKGFIFAAEEDFGIIPVEAMMHGTPVIAYGKGGALESVSDNEINPSGIFFQQQNPTSIISTLNTFEENIANYTSENCIDNAKRFSAERFRDEFKNFVAEKLELFNQGRNNV